MELQKSDYAPEEHALFDSLENLFVEWQLALSKSDNPIVRDSADEMTWDGFYPWYSRQPKKILFLGRDSYGLEGCSYINVFYDIYRENKLIGGSKSLNQSFFHARMLRIAWGLLNGMPEWEDIPLADSIGNQFGTPDGISFAFMNLCKIRNASNGTQADFPAIHAFCEESTKGRNFIAEQISLLAPDLVIAMNFADLLDYVGECVPVEQGKVAKSRLFANGHECLALDSWHFSATKSHVEDYYRPICEAVKKSGW